MGTVGIEKQKYNRNGHSTKLDTQQNSYVMKFVTSSKTLTCSRLLLRHLDAATLFRSLRSFLLSPSSTPILNFRIKIS